MIQLNNKNKNIGKATKIMIYNVRKEEIRCKSKEGRRGRLFLSNI